jgi:hypothetical protein
VCFARDVSLKLQDTRTGSAHTQHSTYTTQRSTDRTLSSPYTTLSSTDNSLSRPHETKRRPNQAISSALCRSHDLCPAPSALL